MENPFLSIVISTYNGELYIRELLNSLLHQTYSGFEIIAVDDCSTDTTFSILQEYTKRGRMNVFRNESNLGINRTFQSGIQKASGDYILLCDQDDIWEPEKLEVLVRHLDGSLLYLHDSALIDEKGRSLSKKQSDRFRLLSNPHPLSFVALNCVTGHACMFDRKLLDYPVFPFPAHVYYDNWLGYMAATYGQIRYIDQCLVQYRAHGKNLTLSKKKARRLNDPLFKVCYAQLDSFYESAPQNANYKGYLRKLRDTYRRKEFKSDIFRAYLFSLKFQKISAFRKKNTLRRWIFCIKLLYKPLPNYFM